MLRNRIHEPSLAGRAASADLVGRMTLEEKRPHRLVNQAGHSTAQCAGLRLVERVAAWRFAGRDDGVS